MSTSRREFLQASAGLAGIAKSLSGAEAKLPTRLLGKTGERVSILAFGSGQRFYGTRSEEDATRFVAQATETGITYFDTADSYARSELILGNGSKARGGKQGLFLATKISSRDGSTVQATIERSLANLQVDQVDLVHIHALEDEDDLARIESKGGVLEALLKARDRKLTRFIGITSYRRGYFKSTPSANPNVGDTPTPLICWRSTLDREKYAFRSLTTYNTSHGTKSFSPYSSGWRSCNARPGAAGSCR
jgi:hypothetical protein